MKSIGRNDPCPCGSGKKYKKCCINKRPRNQYVYVGYKDKFEGVTFQDGEVFVHLPSGEKVKADAIFSQTQYSRASGKDKVLYSISNIATFDILSFLAENFDAVWAIDTNTKNIDGQEISVVSILECYCRKTTSTRINIIYRKNGNIAFKNCPRNVAEKYAWMKLIPIIKANPNYNENQRVALISDHDLNNHSRYNSHELPIYKDYYLPDNFILIYASSDTGKENILNKFIAECEKDAKAVLSQFEGKGFVTIGKTKIAIDNVPSYKTEPPTASN